MPEITSAKVTIFGETYKIENSDLLTKGELAEKLYGFIKLDYDELDLILVERKNGDFYIHYEDMEDRTKRGNVDIIFQWNDFDDLMDRWDAFAQSPYNF